mmetsp:Transcript_13258/g.19533  ORF Transcript_13258/g.19533 Transcript_13258/m.19533 type:complete len:93 (-) Transcript_13258:1481-1759(-)
MDESSELRGNEVWRRPQATTKTSDKSCTNQPPAPPYEQIDCAVAFIHCVAGWKRNATPKISVHVCIIQPPPLSADSASKSLEAKGDNIAFLL